MKDEVWVVRVWGYDEDYIITVTTSKDDAYSKLLERVWKAEFSTYYVTVEYWVDGECVSQRSIPTMAFSRWQRKRRR